MHPDQAALYRGILATPHADLPRLVYADWLEENGRAERAEFIRVQIELANSTPADDDYCDLVEREIELKAILEDELKEELQGLILPAWIDLFPAWRGFLSTTLFSSHDADLARDELPSRLESITERLPTISLSYYGGETTDVDPLLHWLQRPNCDRMTALHVSADGPGITASLLDAFNHCPYLTHLAHLDFGASLNDEEFDRLTNLRTLPALTSPDLLSGGLTSAATSSFARFPWKSRLRRLAFSNYNCRYAELVRQAPLPELRRLKIPTLPTLDLTRLLNDPALYPKLSSLSLTALGSRDLARNDAVGRLELPLRELTLYGFPYSNEVFGDFIRANGLRTLHKLHMAYETWSEYHVAALGGAGLTQLRHFILDARFTAPVVRALTQVPFWRTVTDVSLMGPDGAEDHDEWARFFRETQFPNLRRFFVNGVRFGPPGGHALAENRSLAGLRSLSFYNCVFDDSVVRAILTAPQFQHLSCLQLVNASAGNALDVLADPAVLPVARRIVLEGMDISSTLADKLRARPGVVIR